VVLLGSTRGIVDGVDAYEAIHKPNVSVIGAHAYLGRPERPGAFRDRPSMHEDEACVCALLAQGRLQAAPLISRTWRPGQAAEAYAAARSDPAGTMLPVFDWRR
jgi:threonine dehydrogenase-like Zn-dependent dehydrogenase